MEKNSNLFIRIKELEKRIDLEILHIKELIEVAKDSGDKALALQAKEYERRLEILNHNASQLAQMKNDFVPKGEYFIERESTEARIRTLENYKNNLEGRVYGINIVFGLIVTIINVAIKILWK